MRHILVKGDDLFIHLSWWEKAAARRGNVRVPLATVCRVTVEPDWWRALRGVAQRGAWIPGVMCIGMRGHHGGDDFVAVRPGRPVVCIELWPWAPFSLLAVSVPDHAEATARWLCRLAPRIDSSTCRRQALPSLRRQTRPEGIRARRRMACAVTAPWPGNGDGEAAASE